MGPSGGLVAFLFSTQVHEPVGWERAEYFFFEGREQRSWPLWILRKVQLSNKR